MNKRGKTNWMVTRGDSRAGQGTLLCLFSCVWFPRKECQCVHLDGAAPPFWPVEQTVWWILFYFVVLRGDLPAQEQLILINRLHLSPAALCGMGTEKQSSGSGPTAIVHLEVMRTQSVPVATHKQKRNESSQILFNCAVGAVGGESVLSWNMSGVSALTEGHCPRSETL